MASLVEVRQENPVASNLELVARPLLHVMQFITGLETTFITQIDWERGEQDVLYALNSGDMQVGENGTVAWPDSMCKLAFESDSPVLTNVQRNYPDSLGATVHGMETFVALPIVTNDQTIGSVCGASRSAVKLSSAALEQMRNISEAMSRQMATEISAAQDRERVRLAEWRAQQAHQQAGEIAGIAERFQNLALSDPLTGLGNRRALDASWPHALAEAQSGGYPLSVHMMDIDNFKTVNDTFGHAAGDEVLRAVAAAIKEITRSGDLAFRLGGDEFVLITPRAGISSATSIGQRIAGSFARRSASLHMPATLSVGVASSEIAAWDELLKCADEALYCCKRVGRNTVIPWQRDPASPVV